MLKKNLIVTAVIASVAIGGPVAYTAVSSSESESLDRPSQSEPKSPDRVGHMVDGTLTNAPVHTRAELDEVLDSDVPKSGVWDIELNKTTELWIE